MSRYYEEPIIRNPENEQRKKLTAVTTMRVLSFIVTVVVVIVIPSANIISRVLWSSVFSVGLKVLFLAIAIVPLAVCGVFIWLSYFLRNKLTEEFEYRIQNELFRIIRIVNHSRKKLYQEIPLTAFDRIGKVGTESCRKAEEMVGSDKHNIINAAVNVKTKDLVYYAVVKLDSTKILYFEPSNTMLTELRFAIGRNIIENEKPVF